MIELLLTGSIILTTISILLLLFLISRSFHSPLSQMENRFLSLEKSLEHNYRIISNELAKNREESSLNAKQVREELNQSLHFFNESVLSRMADIANLQRSQLDIF